LWTGLLERTPGTWEMKMAISKKRFCGWLLVTLVILPATSTVAQVPKKAAVFDFELIDTSLEGEIRGKNTAEIERLRLASDRLRRELVGTGNYVLVDRTPAAGAVRAAGFLHGCNGCEVDIARALGAEIAVTGTVQKVSNLILNINVFMADVATRKRIHAVSVDIRGNTDESWTRGVSYLVRNRLSRD
jgi:RNase P/RNase MRP subunit p29